MVPDIIDFRNFYGSPLGDMAHRLVLRHLKQRWDDCSGLSLLGLGFALPYLDGFGPEPLRTIAFMPATLGVVHWPDALPSATALVETHMLPLPDSCIDRLLIIHALETAEYPQQLLSEAWRILTPGGRMIIVAPNRRGVWARLDTTPFGNGQPFSRSQIRDLLRICLFSPLHIAEALYMPPSSRRLMLRAAPAFERFGARLGLPGAGVLIVEATKQLYRPVGVRRPLPRTLPQMQPGLVPSRQAQQSPTSEVSPIWAPAAPHRQGE